jgi:hypothetical protein
VPTPAPWPVGVAPADRSPPELAGAVVDVDVDVDVDVAGAAPTGVPLSFLRVPPTAPPITAPSTMTIATIIMIIPFVVRQNGTVFAEDPYPFSSFAGETEPRSESA